MKPRFVLSSVLAVGALAFAVPGYAQQTTPDVMPPANTGGSGAGTGLTQGGAGPSDGSDQASSQPKAAAAPAGTTGGYSYSDKPAPGAAPRVRYKTTGATVAMPGFEQTSDGGSRFFVQLSQSVTVEERKAQGTITYVMKNASPRVWNNTNALVTVFFSTPVSRARLVASGSDVLFILDLRASSTPTYKIAETADHGAQLTIEFPKGDWLNAPAVQPAAAPAATTTTQRTTTQRARKKK